MATRQVKTVRKTAPAARSNPIRKTAGKPKAAPAALKLATTKAANKERTATSAPKPASMTGPLPPIVTLKHLAEWAGYNHGVAKKQAIEMFTGFVADIGRVLKKGSKIRIPNLGTLQVRIRLARKGRNPATGEEIKIKASRASKKVGCIPSRKGFERSDLICASAASLLSAAGAFAPTAVVRENSQRLKS